VLISQGQVESPASASPPHNGEASMEDRELDDLLGKLSEEIGRTESVSDAEEQSLRRLDSDIQRLLKRSHKQPRAEPEMLEEWESSVGELEAEHPTLTKLISQVLNALSNVGI
jgi:hypothetical protein